MALPRHRRESRVSSRDRPRGRLLRLRTRSAFHGDERTDHQTQRRTRLQHRRRTAWQCRRHRDVSSLTFFAGSRRTTIPTVFQPLDIVGRVQCGSLQPDERLGAGEADEVADGERPW